MFPFTGVKVIPETIGNIDIETNPLDETIKTCIDELCLDLTKRKCLKCFY